MNLINKLKKRKMDNKGFSLVELIIVIAIMAILVGIVGTQVLPYLNKSKEAKDLQILNSYSTAAVTAYSSNADKVAGTGTLTVKVYDSSLTGDAKVLADEIIKLVGYPTINQLWDSSAKTGKMGSDEGRKVTEITIVYDFANKTVTTTATGTALDEVHADL